LITTISISLLLITFLHPIQAQSIPLDQKNATLILNFTSEFDRYEGGSVAFSHNDDMFVYSSIMHNPRNWTSQIWSYYLKNDTSKFIGFNGSSSRGFYGSFIGELRFSSDGEKLLFIGGSCDGNEDHTTFYIITLQSPRLQCNNLTNVASADWMPDGSIVLAQNNEQNDTISIYQNGTEKLLYTKPITPPDDSLNSSHIMSINTSHDGKKIALGYSIRLYQETQILDIEKEKIINTFPGSHPRWSQDDNTLLYLNPTTAGHYTNGPLKSRTYVNLLNVDDNKTTNIDTVNMGVDDLALSRDSKTVFYVMRIPYPYDFLNFTSGVYKIDLRYNENNSLPPPVCEGCFFPANETKSKIDSPLTQFKSGIPASKVVCKQGFQFIMKKENGQFTCVKMETANELFDRGWGIYPVSIPDP